MDMKSTPAKSPNLRRWSSISPSVTTGRSSPSATLSSSSDDLELLPMKAASHYHSRHSYSSLKDLLPAVAAVNSPKLKSTPPRSDICIRNRLVKQAARAYLSPMSDYPSSGGGNFFHRLWTGVAAFIDFFCVEVVRILDGALRAVRIRSDGFKMCLV
ncbi:hypothetical protein C2S52_019578 [Perilla frutescens var. hirtella]|nr:hypothetical protein C2S52_019578 [Perilla frutescens var. hirtella]KAH6806166.1 hypothetical protein C2S51_030997 [Perilla frutescens var. frutescens]